MQCGSSGALDTVSGWETQKHVPWVHLGAGGAAAGPCKLGAWGAKGCQARGVTSEVLQEVRAGTAPEMLSSCCLISANETCKAGLGERVNQDERVWDNLALRY